MIFTPELYFCAKNLVSEYWRISNSGINFFLPFFSGLSSSGGQRGFSCLISRVPHHPLPTLWAKTLMCIKDESCFWRSWDALKQVYHWQHKQRDPGVQSMVSFTSLLMTNLLTVVAKVFSNTLIFLLHKCE